MGPGSFYDMDIEDKKLEHRVSQIALDRLRPNGNFELNDAIIRDNTRLRDAGGAPTDTIEWGYNALNIPVDHMRVLQIRYPELASLDPATQHNAWKKFLRSPESAPYRVRRNDGKRVATRGIIVK